VRRELSTQVRETLCLYSCSEHCDQEVRELRTQGERISVLYIVIRRWGGKGVENIGDRDSLYWYTVIRR
jgi:hypothetical protein